MFCIYTYSFLPQAPLGAVSSAAEDKDGKLMLEDISGAAFILTLALVVSISVSSPDVWSSAANRSIGSTTGCTITEKAPTRAPIPRKRAKRKDLMQQR